MPVEIITSGENVDIGLKAETVVGTLEQAVYEIFQTRGGELDYPSNEATDETTGDHGGPLDKRTISRGGDANFPAHLRYDGNKALAEAAFRDDFPTPVTIVGTSDIEIDPAGTHEDGSTGLVIIGADGGFSDLITYAGASANGAEGLLLLVEGFAASDNNQPVLVKNVWSNPNANGAGVAGDQIDVFDAYGGGTAGDPFGAPKQAESGVSATLRAGEAIRNRQSEGAGVRRAYSILVDFFEKTTAGRFLALRGWTANDFQVAVSGKGEVIVTVNGNGRGWSPMSMTPQNGEAAGSHFNDNTPDNPMYIGGEDLQFLAICPFPNALVATAVPILLSDMNVSSFDATLAGNVQTVDDIVGTDEIVPRKGPHDPSGSLNWYDTDDSVVEQITEIGAKPTRQNAALHVGWKDDQDRWIILNYLKNNFQATGPNPSSRGSAVTGTLNFGGMRLSKNARAVVLQQIDAGS